MVQNITMIDKIFYQIRLKFQQMLTYVQTFTPKMFDNRDQTRYKYTMDPG